VNEWATAQEFRLKQKLPYESKVLLAKQVAREFYQKLNGNVICSVGGLDSITLLYFLRKYVSKDIPGLSVSSLEDLSIQRIHRQIPNLVILKPYKTKVQVIRDHGYPVISKEKAGKIQMLQNPTKKNATVRHAIMTGDTGAYGGWRKGTRMKLPQKWLELFAGLENEKYGTNYKIAPFRVSPDCCYYMKKKPCDDFIKQNKLKTYMGLLASEGGQREKALMRHGCNYFGKTVVRSCPFAVFSRTDVLRLALELEVPIPAIYGEIVRQPDGTLETTRAKRTGCSMCGFGIHIEQRPHRFDRLRQDNPKEWHFWMYKMGWGKVLDYIGVKWEDEYKPINEREQLDGELAEMLG
jgi:hypothetical protein